MPLSESLHTPDGEALGIASVELSLDHIVRNLLDDTDSGDGITLLLDAEGRILAYERKRVSARSARSPDPCYSQKNNLSSRSMLTAHPPKIGIMHKALLFTCLALTTQAFGATLDDAAALVVAQPHELIVDHSLPEATVAATRKSVDAFYGFWNNGSPTLLDAAISPDFTDRTLPKGRPQGRDGPTTASKAMLAAVPDLKVTVEQMLIVGDRVVAHLRLSGHFTGTFMGTAGTGQTVDIIATDILRVTDGRITDNWHLEDNLTFLQQLGLVK